MRQNLFIKGFIAAVAVLTLWPSIASAKVFTVNTTDDGDDLTLLDGVCNADINPLAPQCTLRAAITEANAQGGDDVIVFTIPTSDPGFDPSTGRFTINLTKALPDLSTNITVDGPGADELTVRRSSESFYRIFTVTNMATVTISGLTISGGYVFQDAGGAISNNGGTTTVNDCILTANSADYGGGAVANYDGGGVATLVLNDCELSDNTAPYSIGGSVVNTGNAFLEIHKCLIRKNSAGDGGGIANLGGSEGSAVLTIVDSTITENSGVNANSGGGGIYNDAVDTGSAVLNVRNSKITDNSAPLQGGGIHNVGGSVHIESSSLKGNSAYNGGAIYSYFRRANVEIIDSTLSGNSTDYSGSAIVVSSYGSNNDVTAFLTNTTVSDNSCRSDQSYLQCAAIVNGQAFVQINNCTISDNVATFGQSVNIYNQYSGTLQIGNTILKASSAGTNIGHDYTPGVTSYGHNLSNDDGSGLLTGPGDQINTDPMLDPAGLQDNGGPTETIALLPTSPAIDAGDDANAPLGDQRNYMRVGTSDIGAFEYGGTIANAVSRKIHPGSPSLTGDINLPLTGAAGVECRTGGPTSDYQLVVTFASPVTVNGNPQASVSGTGQIGSDGTSNGELVSVNGNVVTVPLTSVANAQTLTVTLLDVSDGTNVYNLNIPMGVLVGDTNGDGVVNSADIGQTKSQSGNTVTSTNLREDLNVDGVINSADIGLVKSKSGTALQ